ncbi:MAG: hypothetical protein UU77_C0003G0033 [candidate division WWE3 bacterium GW2011_GWC1_41_7]|uniref:Uncharacterized protein n=4 Tax=Katanobacteria TaxID=422282 RepID=A0A0G1A7I1_UNCKA|nr:MAG: hypothetical protein UU72_C0018G0009 [candidate division WWE3 bacterium GW2011_GWB1_41_6]KKS21253.1 MAG: hypothetical protein UU80_C0032G0017 [candidate division WWE3 bacterium GW2011_GWA1_41_8]KKS21405.1 MAG: hypothetical protein UU77_C0003G0033 [candidate division WWE3 bacterium GW2011_GWC1_41_7]OGC56410.1 MAG: hypothetical protein A2976_01145 [candidate division WWE3 bacterium RIFCSPLOWO2_01_FULL_41_9]
MERDELREGLRQRLARKGGVDEESFGKIWRSYIRLPNILSGPLDRYLETGKTAEIEELSVRDFSYKRLGEMFPKSTPFSRVMILGKLFRNYSQVSGELMTAYRERKAKG